jgi:hypothetical protein
VLGKEGGLISAWPPVRSCELFGVAAGESSTFLVVVLCWYGLQKKTKVPLADVLAAAKCSDPQCCHRVACCSVVRWACNGAQTLDAEWFQFAGGQYKRA